jgi:predicted outer membrane repeat protein
MKSGIDLRHVNSLTENCIIDANTQGRVMIFDGVDATSSVSYMTFREGHAAGSGSAGCGGGLFFTNYSSPKIWLCDFENNVADEMGGAIYCEDHSSPVLNWEVLRWNQAGAGGGGLACASSAAPVFNYLSLTGDITSGNGGGAHCSDDATPHFERCNILNCVAAGFGGGIYTETGSVPLVERSIIVFNMDGEGVYAADDLSIPTLKCCAIYGNEGGDFVG